MDSSGNPLYPLSQGSVTSFAISADGRFLAFTSNAPDLVPGQSPDDWGARLYLYDRLSSAPALIGHVSNLQVDPGDVLRLSASGQQVAFTSFDSTLVTGDLNTRSDVFLYTVPAGPVTLPPCNLFSGSLRSNARKTLAAAGACGVPAGVKQVAVKLTVSQSTGRGNVQLYPGNVTSPAAGILRFNRGVTRSAGFTVSLGNGGIALLPFVAGNGTVRVTVEVDGYTP